MFHLMLFSSQWYKQSTDFERLMTDMFCTNVDLHSIEIHPIMLHRPLYQRFLHILKHWINPMEQSVWKFASKKSSELSCRKHCPNLIFSQFPHERNFEVIVFLSFVTFSKVLLALFSLWFCPAFWWLHINMYFVFRLFTSRTTSLLA